MQTSTRFSWHRDWYNKEGRTIILRPWSNQSPEQWCHPGEANEFALKASHQKHLPSLTAKSVLKSRRPAFYRNNKSVKWNQISSLMLQKKARPNILWWNFMADCLALIYGNIWQRTFGFDFKTIRLMIRIRKMLDSVRLCACTHASDFIYLLSHVYDNIVGPFWRSIESIFIYMLMQNEKWT